MRRLLYRLRRVIGLSLLVAFGVTVYVIFLVGNDHTNTAWHSCITYTYQGKTHCG